jgi:hypothetical protein
MENRSRELGFPSKNNFDIASVIELGIAGYKLGKLSMYLYHCFKEESTTTLENKMQKTTENFPDEIDQITENLNNTNLNEPITDQTKKNLGNTDTNSEKGWFENWNWDGILDNCRYAYIQWSVVNIISNCQEFYYLHKVCRELPQMINDGPYKEKLLSDIRNITESMTEFSVELKDIYNSQSKRETEKCLKLLQEKFKSIMNKFEEMMNDVKAVLEETKKLKSKQKFNFWKNFITGIVGIGLFFVSPGAAGARVAAGVCSAGNLVCACANLHFINELGILIDGYEAVKTKISSEQLKNLTFSNLLQEKVNGLMQQTDNLSNQQLNEISQRWKNMKNSLISYEELRDAFNNGKLTSRGYIDSVFHNLFN